MDNIKFKKKIIHHHFNGYLILDEKPNDIRLYITINNNTIIFNINKIETVGSTVKKLYINNIKYNSSFPLNILSLFNTLGMLEKPTLYYLISDREDKNIYYLKNSTFSTAFILV